MSRPETSQGEEREKSRVRARLIVFARVRTGGPKGEGGGGVRGSFQSTSRLDKIQTKGASFQTPVSEVVLEDVEQRGHLRKDEDLVSPLVELLQHAVHQGQLPGGAHQQLAKSDQIENQESIDESVSEAAERQLIVFRLDQPSYHETRDETLGNDDFESAEYRSEPRLSAAAGDTTKRSRTQPKKKNKQEAAQEDRESTHA